MYENKIVFQLKRKYNFIVRTGYFNVVPIFIYYFKKLC